MDIFNIGFGKKRDATVADKKAKVSLMDQLKDAQQRVQELERKSPNG